MSFAILESGAVVVALLIGWEMRRQGVPWRSVVVRAIIALGVLTAMIAAWRGR